MKIKQVCMLSLQFFNPYSKVSLKETLCEQAKIVSKTYTILSETINKQTKNGANRYLR